jgi:hypothetical protein
VHGATHQAHAGGCARRAALHHWNPRTLAKLIRRRAWLVAQAEETFRRLTIEVFWQHPAIIMLPSRAPRPQAGLSAVQVDST